MLTIKETAKPLATCQNSGVIASHGYWELWGYLETNGYFTREVKLHKLPLPPFLFVCLFCFVVVFFFFFSHFPAVHICQRWPRNQTCRYFIHIHQEWETLNVASVGKPSSYLSLFPSAPLLAQLIKTFTILGEKKIQY